MNHEVNVGRIPEGESDIMGIREKKMNIPNILMPLPQVRKSIPLAWFGGNFKKLTTPMQTTGGGGGFGRNE